MLTIPKPIVFLLGFPSTVLNFVMLACKYVIHIARVFKKQLHFRSVLAQVRRAKAGEALACKHLGFNNLESVITKRWGELVKYSFS